MFHSPIPLATAPADGDIAAGSAAIRPQGTFPGKADTDRGSQGGRNAHFMDAADFPFIQHIEITGIGGAVALQHQIGAAAAAGCAGTGTVTDENMDIVIKKTDAVIVAGSPILIPQIKYTA